jgi:REP element-mobilizing transposase RayT
MLSIYTHLSMPDHVHIFLSFPLRYSIAHVVGMLKSISGCEIFDKFPEVKKDLWGVLGGWIFCEDGGRQGDRRFDQEVYQISS